MPEPLGQLRPVGLMCGVTGQTIGLAERLPPVGFDERLVFYIMTRRTQRVRLRSQMKIEFRISRRPCFVNYVTGVAPHIEGLMPAPICRDVQPDIVTFKTKVLGPAA